MTDGAEYHPGAGKGAPAPGGPPRTVEEAAAEARRSAAMLVGAVEALRIAANRTADAFEALGAAAAAAGLGDEEGRSGGR